MRAICTYVGCTKVTINNQDIRLSVTVSTIKLMLKSAHQTVSDNIWYIS